MKVVVPNRISRSYTQSLCRPPGEVFPLLCPLLEGSDELLTDDSPLGLRICDSDQLSQKDVGGIDGLKFRT